MVNNDSIPQLLAAGYECLKNADLVAANRFFEQALGLDFEHGEVLYALKCARYWDVALADLAAIQAPLAKGDRLVSRWRNFQDFLSRIPGNFESTIYAFKRLCFGMALEQYLAIQEQDKTTLGADFDFRAGRCRKALGDYETALQHLERTVKARRDDARYLAELADCHGLSGEQRLSKVLFREAFFIGPDRIELEYLESDLIARLARIAREAGVPRQSVAEWIPVYGELEKVFDVKRALGTQDSSRLNSSILRMENDIRENPALADSLKPRLIVRYFWLLDHYRSVEAESSKIERTISKLKLLDPVVYERYIA